MMKHVDLRQQTSNLLLKVYPYYNSIVFVFDNDTCSVISWDDDSYFDFYNGDKFPLDEFDLNDILKLGIISQNEFDDYYRIKVNTEKEVRFKLYLQLLEEFK